MQTSQGSRTRPELSEVLSATCPGWFELERGASHLSLLACHLIGARLAFQAAELILSLDYAIYHISCPSKLRDTG